MLRAAVLFSLVAVLHAQGFVPGCSSGVALSDPDFNALYAQLKAQTYPTPRMAIFSKFLSTLHVGFTGAQIAQIMILWHVDDSTKLKVFHMASRWVLGLKAEDVVTIITTAQYDESRLTLLAGVVSMIYQPELTKGAEAIIAAFQYQEDKNKARTLLTGATPVSCVWGDVSTVKAPYFIIDISRSMLDTFTLANGTTGNRIEYVKQELQTSITQLSSSQSFNVLAFSSRTYPWAKSLQAVSDSTITSAVNWVGALKVKSSTGMYKALKTAFADPNCDGIFLCSDGQPTDASTSTIIKATQAWSKSKGNAPLNAILFEAGSHPYPNDPGAKTFMQNLANSCNGVFKDLEK